MWDRVAIYFRANLLRRGEPGANLGWSGHCKWGIAFDIPLEISGKVKAVMSHKPGKTT